MTIDFTTEDGEGLFDRLGKIGNVINNVNEFRGTTIAPDYEAVSAAYDSHRDLAANVPADLAGLQNGATGSLNDLKRIAEQTIIVMVKEDNRQPDDTLTTSLKEVIRQMEAESETIDSNTVSGSVAADSGNYGDGEIVVSVKNGKGQLLQFAHAEDVRLVCTNDSYSGGITAGLEQFQAKGEFAETNKLNFLFPKGSGGQVSLSAVSPSFDASSGNLITNGDFEAFTGSTPDDWDVIAGTEAVEFDDTATAYDGSLALAFIGTGTDAKLAQDLSGSLLPNNVYHCSFRARLSATATGTFSVRLYDVTNSTPMQDDQTAGILLATDLGDLSTSWQAVSFSFSTPKLLPDEYRLELFGATIESGKSVYVDHLTLTKATQLYLNGPYVSAHAGDVAFLKDDGFTVTISNSYESAWGTLLERLFDLNAKELTFPTHDSGSETISDSLIG